jgi:hypothetical protein
MPFALLIVGVFLVVAGVRNTAGPVSQQGTLFNLIHGDFTGQDNFIYWFLAIVIVGMLGYVPKLKPISTGLLVLIIVVLFLRKGGFFQQFTSAISGSTGSSPTGSLSTAQQLANQQAITSSLTQQLSQNLSTSLGIQ